MRCATTTTIGLGGLADPRCRDSLAAALAECFAFELTGVPPTSREEAARILVAEIASESLAAAKEANDLDGYLQQGDAYRDHRREGQRRVADRLHAIVTNRFPKLGIEIIP